MYSVVVIGELCTNNAFAITPLDEVVMMSYTSFLYSCTMLFIYDIYGCFGDKRVLCFSRSALWLFPALCQLGWYVRSTYQLISHAYELFFLGEAMRTRRWFGFGLFKRVFVMKHKMKSVLTEQLGLFVPFLEEYHASYWTP